MKARNTPAPSPRRECHRCPLNGRGDDYCWKKCLGPADGGSGDNKPMSNKGISKVSLGAMPAEDEYLYNNAVEEFASARFTHPAERLSTGGSTGLSASKLDYEVERGLVKVLATFMSLSDVQLCIFRHIFNGENISSVGARLLNPISKQAVSKHLYSMCDSDPVISKVLRSLVRLDGTGRSRRDRNSDRPITRRTLRQPTQLQFDIFTDERVDESGNACNSVTRTRGA